MNLLSGIFSKYPELAVFFALGIGYWIGGFKFRGFSLGGVTGSLMAGIGTGYLFHVPVSATAKSVVFLLFLFGIGYSVGPKFFKAMRGDGWKFGMLGVFVPVVGLIAAVAVAKILRLDPGFAGGLVCGALTESPAIGTASEAIQSLAVPDELKQKWIAHVAVGDALCYLFGAFGVIWVCSSLGPRLLGIDLKAEAEKLEKQYGMQRTKSGVASAWRPYELRSYRVEATARMVGRTVAEAEQLVPGARLFIERVRRDSEIMEATPGLVLQVGDVIAVGGKREVLLQTLDSKAEEINERELMDMPVATYEVFVMTKAIAGRTLEELSGIDVMRGVFLRRIMRGTHEIPIGAQTVIERGDILHLTGPERALDRAVELVGETILPSDRTDFAAVCFAIFIGAVAGSLLAVPVGGISIAIGTSVGTLLAGVMTGYIRSVRPLFGRVPDGAVAFMQSFGLAAFVAMVGLGAGPEFVTAIKEAGIGLLFGGMIVTLTPQLAGLYFGRHVLKLNPLLLLGGLSGAQTFTAGLAAVQEKSGSPIAVLGYSGAVPVAHILLTTWGTLIVLFTSR
ncbi:MAG: aspartate-alanine antiporter [Verrucomicrobiaceae bacterium]|nr:MAG: aspartate-alanine antiporter [Verrucomicrobiaceae bacterium]